MRKAIITIPVPDGYTSQRYFEFDLDQLKVDVKDRALVVSTDEGLVVHLFAPGQWSRLEFPTDD